ncbi:unnamed protein product [Miscanthus lutarioriparius]|uniref:Rhamnogalacturonase A/B/Epimerase-like pectate lyase domain-containing protein n=1 Tax=Miscanthus lutarioriparius TaxID=422564 RepID=A0A811MN32_9POAL|nr:unnamed protein product [Miscanthus lutarioriparius]
MASSRKLLKRVFMSPLLALLFLSGVFKVAGASNDTSSDGASYLRSSGASEPAAATRGRSLASPPSQSVFSLDHYGARGDGRHDDTQALEKAWKAACASAQPAVVLVPEGRHYLLKLVALCGPVQVQCHVHGEGHSGCVAEPGGLERQ